MTKKYSFFRYPVLFVVITGLFLTMFVGPSIFFLNNVHFRLKQKLKTDSNHVFSALENNTTKTYKMLWYNPPHWMWDRTPKWTRYCKYRNCEIIFNKNEIVKSELVLFSHAYINKVVPPKKTDNNTWVFVSLESPVLTGKDYMEKHWMNKFDWLMSYRPESDGFAPYGKCVPNTIDRKRNYTFIYNQKTEDVAWVVSHCGSISKRDQYVKEMNKTIKVDIFGKCGKPCPANCFKTLSKKYKFYLSFENAICSDYVTEKLFNIFQDDIDLIPVFRGAPNVKQLLPNLTFISTIDFSSPEKLALYLKDLGSNETKYLSMLKSKHKYIKVSANLYQNMMCEMCERLNTNYKRLEKLDLANAMSISQCAVPLDV